MANSSLFNITWNTTSASTIMSRECVGDAFYSVECLHKHFCPQLSSYFVNAGIVIVILYLIYCWVGWWYWNRGYKRFDLSEASRIFGDFTQLEDRQRWDVWIRHQFTKAMLLYIVVVVYLNV